MRALCSGLSAHADFAAQAACSVHQAPSRFLTIARHGGGADQGSAWLAASCLGDLTTWQRAMAKSHSRARTNRTRGVPARRKCIAEVGGRRCGPEKRRRSAPLTRRSGVCVAGGLARQSDCPRGNLGTTAGGQSNVESRIAAAKLRDRPKKASNLRTQSPIDGRHLGLWTSCDLHGHAA